MMRCSAKPCEAKVIAKTWYFRRADAKPLQLCEAHLNRTFDLADEGTWGEPLKIEWVPRESP